MQSETMRSVTACILIAFVFTLAGSVAAAEAEVAVIANPSVPVTHMTSTDLLDVYTGDVREWKDGAPVIVFDLKPRSAIKDAFYKFLGKSSSRMKSIWMKNMLSGDGRPPQARETEEEILQTIASTPGAIGYVNRALVTEGVVELVVIPVDEK